MFGLCQGDRNAKQVKQRQSKEKQRPDEVDDFRSWRLRLQIEKVVEEEKTANRESWPSSTSHVSTSCSEDESLELVRDESPPFVI
jgi:hypothetical protein